MSDGRVVFGIDLRDDITQISYCTGPEEGVRTYSVSSGIELFSIPTEAVKLPDGEWCFGDEAREMSNIHGLPLVTDLLSRAVDKSYYRDRDSSEDSVVVSNPEKLLGDFLSFVTYLPDIPGDLEVVEVVVTVEEMKPNIPSVITRVLRRSRDDIKSVRCISHDESFFYYSLNQPIDLWQHGVLLYKFNKDVFLEKRLIISTDSIPAVAKVETVEHPEMLIYSDNEGSEKDEVFGEIAETALDEKTSSVCVTGSGFDGGWAKGTYKLMCRKTRVFQGQNLFTKGACYAASESIFMLNIQKHYIFFDENKLRVNVGIRAFDNTGCEKVIWAVDAGNSWYDSRAQKDVLIGEDREMFVVLHSVSSRNERNTLLRLDWLPERPEHCSRVRMEFFFKSVSELIIRISDLGFGSFFRSSGIVREECLDLDGM